MAVPELPEVEIAKRGLEPYLLGRVIQRCTLNSAGLRYPFGAEFAQTLNGTRVSQLARRGKFILAHLENSRTLIWHLGMSGRIRTYADQGDYVPEKHDHVVMVTDNQALVVYHDPRRFGFMKLVDTSDWEAQSHFATMGPEPLGNGFSGAILARVLQGKTIAIKQALLDQNIVAGVGNIYASEALYLAEISPLRPAGTLGGVEVEKLAQAVRDVLLRAIDAGGSSLRDYQHTDGTLGYFQHMFGVYNRAGGSCPDCNCDISQTSGVQKIVQGGRSTFYCPRRQK